jgi:hypothetical protein|tara:strand:- start:2222 stop:2773 length:552 start_codon:yes stop_codon:yes gene_type:complete
MLKEALEDYTQSVYVKTKRSKQTYEATASYVIRNLTRLVDEYVTTKNDEQTYRLIRDDMDKLLRRYHQYCIKENIGAHYYEVGLEGNGIFEHMIPVATIVDLLIKQKITTHQACNMPTCRLSYMSDQALKDAGWNSKTPDVYNFWTRYEYSFTVDHATFETHEGMPVNINMTLDQHFNMWADN